VASKSVSGVIVFGERLHRQPHVAFGRHLHGGLVGQMTVLDRLDTRDGLFSARVQAVTALELTGLQPGQPGERFVQVGEYTRTVGALR